MTTGVHKLRIRFYEVRLRTLINAGMSLDSALLDVSSRLITDIKDLTEIEVIRRHLSKVCENLTSSKNSTGYENLT